MIDKLTPRFLDKSSDYKLVRKTSLIDALNIYVDTETGGEHTAGVIKPIKGTQAVVGNFAQNEDYKAIGSVTDENTGVVYFFVWSSDSAEHSIWAYDHRGVLPNVLSYVEGVPNFGLPQKGNLYRVLKSNQLKFPVNGFVKGDVVYTNTREFDKYDDTRFGPYPEKDALLYFTDNKNEPRKVNVYRALIEGVPSGATTDQLDFICACPRVPLERPDFVFKADLDRDVNNFATTPGFQFAYQAIYKDGLESAISPYSVMAFPPSVVDRGALTTDNILAHNKCEITIPAQGEEVEAVKILARYGNGANFIEIQEVENENPMFPIVFDFYNDRVATGVSPQTVDKTFDNVPQKAQAQAVTSNRLVYGNYVEGYDNVDCSGVDLEPVYIKRPPELIDYNLKIEPSIEMLKNSDHTNKSVGFVYKTDQFAEEIASNTKITISFSLSPDGPFHIYNVINPLQPDIGGTSYHQSRQVGAYSLNLPGYTEEGVNPQSAAFYQENDGYGEPGYQEDIDAGGSFLHHHRDNYFGNTIGLGGDDISTGPGITAQSTYWRRKVALQEGDGFPDNHPIRAAYGTSAGNPLILEGGKLTFRVSFTVNVPVSSGGKSLISKVFSMLMEGASQGQIDTQLELGPGAVTFDPEDIKRTHVHSINLGIESRSPIQSEGDEGGLRNLICGWGGLQPATVSPINDLGQKPPSGAFIVNKAEVGFFLQRSKTRNPGMHNAFVLGVGYVDVDDEDGLMTCIRDMDPRSPWWAISKSDMDSISVNPFQAFQDSFQVPNRVFRRKFNWKENFYTYNSGTNRHGMNNSWGYMVVGQDDSGAKNLLPDRVDIDANLFGVPEHVFQYSLMDGEGGPGGSGAGEGTAYDALGCGRLGSIAGQCFVGVDEDDILHAPGRAYQAYMDNNGQTDFFYNELFDGTIADDLDLDETDVPLGEFTYYDHTSIFMGPLYTGKIVLNNIGISDANGNPTSEGSVNGRVLPFDESLTTTLPLVAFASWSSAANNNGITEPLLAAPAGMYNSGVFVGEGDAAVQANGNNLRQVSYPYPIMLSAEEGGGGIIDGELVSGTPDVGVFEGYSSVDFERLHSHVELTFNVTSVEVEGASGSLSFKSSATHEIGMVYYDERGRHGRVNPIGSVYVEGYGERGDKPKGKAMVRVSNITHEPPSWAKKYKFVYTKNTTVDSFIQYSAGGAFITNSDYEGSNPTNVYVSLNYLQGHPISYSDSFGARGEDDTPVMYSFTPGDRLRVISYMLSEQDEQINRVYPVGADFEVTGVVNFVDEDNPFVVNVDGSAEVTEAMKGLFLVLKNNDDAFGFRHQAVQQGTSNWGRNCIFEIYSPIKELDAEDRLYYEIGDCYDVVYTPEGYKHDFEQVILKEGDVFFRRHAVNLRDYNLNDGFVDMLSVADNEEEDVSPEPNFKNYYLESEAATDLFPSRSVSIGRPNIVDADSRQSHKESSIVHSDRDVVGARKVGYSSFNRTIPSDLEIDVKPGPINYLSNHQDSLFFIQKNKCGQIPVDRSLLADTQGSSSLIASSKFLNRPRYFAVDAGCDGNPESVVNVDNIMYFAHKSAGKVFKAGGNAGVQIISDKNMSSFIRNAFHDTIDSSSGLGIRVIGGYDPLKKEYLLSIVPNDFASVSGETFPEPDVLWSAGTEDVDEDGVAFAFAAEVDLPEEFEELVLDPQISIDWNSASGFDDPSWSLVYADNGNLNESLSYWQPSQDPNSQVALNTDAEIVIKFQDAQGFDSPQVINLSIGQVGSSGSFEQGIMNSAAFDIADIDLNPGTLAYDTVNELGYYDGDQLVLYPNTAWNFNPAVTDEEGVTASGAPHVGLTITMDPDVFSGDVEFRIPLRFLCDPQDPFQILQTLNIAPLETTVASFKGAIQITGAINENITLNAGVVFQDIEDEYALGVNSFLGGDYLEETDLEDPVFDVPLYFNPCHPVYGSWVASDGNGGFDYFDYLSHMTEDRIRLWINDSLSDAGLDQTYDDLNSETQVNMFSALVSYLIFNPPIFGECLNINYSDDADDEPLDV